MSSIINVNSKGISMSIDNFYTNKIKEENKELKKFIINIKKNSGYDEKELNKIVNEIVKENLK
ncbi:hypothetical protein [Staphylococcus phage LY01]|nr:hypothetical protein [Staphylococcus phage LY01]